MGRPDIKAIQARCESMECDCDFCDCCIGEIPCSGCVGFHSGKIESAALCAYVLELEAEIKWLEAQKRYTRLSIQPCTCSGSFSTTQSEYTRCHRCLELEDVREILRTIQKGKEE